MASMHGGLPVETTVLHSQPVNQSGIYQATLISRHSVVLQPQVSGQIENIYVKAGDSVKAGQLLLLIDKKKQEASLKSSQANAASAKATVEQARNLLQNYESQREALLSNLSYSKKMYDRYTALYAKRSVSQQDLDKYTDNYNKAKADLNANTTQILAQKAAIETAKSNYEKTLFQIKEQEVELQYHRITAPFAGIVGDIPVKIGNIVNQSTPLLSITQNNPLEVNVGLPVEKVFEIRKGLKVEVLDNNDKVIETSQISFVSPRVDTATQTILVKANINNKLGILKADQSVKVRIIYNTSRGIFAPTSAISHFGSQDFVFTVNKKGNMFFVKQQPVKLGELQGDKYVVLNGLKDNDQIVTQGIQKLMDGAPITILEKGKK